MTPEEIRLKCLELAMEQAKRENLHADRKSVAEIASEFYSHVIGEAKAETPKANRRSKGKSEIFT